MPTIRQLPRLLLRGSIANVTMRGLTPEQKLHVDGIYNQVVRHPELTKHRVKVIRELGSTIRGDYHDDKTIAEQEYNIAIWRGVVHLFHHKNYSFKCSNCGSTHSTTQRGKPKLIDRATVPCPVCRMAEVATPGCSDYRVGDIVNHDEAQIRFRDQMYDTPTFRSCIKPIADSPRYENPDQIIDCPKQLKKFFGEFVWNYFRQQLNENKRKQLVKKLTDVSGPADQMITESIVSLCDRMRVDYNRNHKIEKTNGKYVINLASLTTPPEFTSELVALKCEALGHNIRVIITENNVEVIAESSPGIITVKVLKPQHAMMMENQVVDDGDESVSGFSVEQLSHKTTKGSNMNQEDHVAMYDIADAASKTRSSLSDPTCVKIYDIFMQVGEIYDDFATTYGDGTPKINHIAEYLKISPRDVKKYKEQIQICCLANDFVPSYTNA